MIHRHREIIFSLVIAIATLILYFIPTGFANPELTKNIIYSKSEVLSVDNSGIEQISVVTLGTQVVALKLLSGEHKGESIEAINELLGDKRKDKLFEVGDRVLCRSMVTPTPPHTIVNSVAEEFYRMDLILVLIIAFIGVLILLAGVNGVKAALSFIFTAMTFMKLLIPAMLSGYSPLFVSIGIVFISTTAIILLVGGVTRKGVVALLGSMAGVVATALMAIVFGALFKIPGTVMEYSENLLYAGFSDLNFSDIFISCIFISSAGAVMDVAMDIAAAQEELIDRAPLLTCRELIRSGLNIASPVVGSMTTTLLFAYSGSFMFAFMAFMAQGAPLENIINRGFISAEILHTIVGSFGLILVAPLTALIGGIIYTRKHRKLVQ